MQITAKYSEIPDQPVTTWTLMFTMFMKDTCSLWDCWQTNIPTEQQKAVFFSELKTKRKKITAFFIYICRSLPRLAQAN